MSTSQEQNNRRQLEKERRKKTFEDSQVQGTNNSSIVSKRSVELIYSSLLPGEWFKYFVPGKKRRSPAINRGYFIRMECIRQTIHRIRENTSQPINIVNLGCGFDVLAFQLWDHGFTFYDIDYPELVQRKLAVIRQTPRITDLVGPDDGSRQCGLVYSSERYKLIGCDLKNSQKYNEILKSVIGDGVNIFIAEVSLAYMEHQDANRIIELSSSTNSHFLVLEQILPCGKDHSFAQKMLKHFSKLRSSLKCVEHYPTKKDQAARFRQYYPNVEINNLFENWTQLIDYETKKKVHELEPFDEWEEFIVFCQHYVLVHATNNQLVYSEPESDVFVTADDPLTVEFSDSPLTLKFAAACEFQGSILVHGGLNQTREDKAYLLGPQTVAIGGPSARMCHSLTTVGTRAILIGGRTSPGTLLSDVWAYDGTWTRLADLARPVFRHSVVALDKNRLLIVGDGWYIYDLHSQKSQVLDVPQAHARLLSCGLHYDQATATGMILGGMADPIEPAVNDSLVQFTISGNAVQLTAKLAHRLLQRIDPKVSVQADQLLVVGGTCAKQLLDRNNTIMSVALSSLRLKNVPIDETSWKKWAPTAIGANLVETPTRVSLVNGGAVWYSFGNHFNAGWSIVRPDGCKTRCAHATGKQ